MSNIEVTSGVLRAVADWYEQHRGKGFETIITELREDATLLDEKTAEDEKVERLARLFYATETRAVANLIDGIDYPQYDEREEAYREGTRAGIRAVLARLDELNEDENPAPASWPRSWINLSEIPDNVQRVVRTTDGIVFRRETDGRWRNQYGNSWRTLHGHYTEVTG